MRDRLIEVLFESEQFNGADGKADANTLADHLLANGVIVPPCKVGDVAYHLTSIDTLEELNVAEIFEGKVCSISKDEKNLWIFCRYDNGLNYWYTEKDIGRKLFLVRKEAERALKGDTTND